LNRELGIERLLLEGGGGSNGSFLRAGLIDEISLAICPAIDGAKGAPSIFDSSDRDTGIPAPITSMTLTSTEVLEGGAVWLRYRCKTADAQRRPSQALARGPPSLSGDREGSNPSPSSGESVSRTDPAVAGRTCGRTSRRARAKRQNLAGVAL
jgi:hypothetical protein